MGNSHVLNRILHGLHLKNAYLNEYNSFLLGLTEPESFIKFSNAIARKYEELPLSDIISAIRLLMEAVDPSELDDDYLSDILNVQIERIHEARSELHSIANITIKTKAEPIQELINVSVG